jgi:hypothetical protein
LPCSLQHHQSIDLAVAMTLATMVFSSIPVLCAPGG